MGSDGIAREKETFYDTKRRFFIALIHVSCITMCQAIYSQVLFHCCMLSFATMLHCLSRYSCCVVTSLCLPKTLWMPALPLTPPNILVLKFMHLAETKLTLKAPLFMASALHQTLAAQRSVLPAYEAPVCPSFPIPAREKMK